MNTAHTDIEAATLDTAEILAVRKRDTGPCNQQCTLFRLRNGGYAVVVILRLPAGCHTTKTHTYTTEAEARQKLDFESTY